jgi:hypothetical protein
MICTACENLTINRLYARGCEHDPTTSEWKQAGYLILHDSYEALEAAAADGCQNCRTFHSRFVDTCGDVQGLRVALRGRRVELLMEDRDASPPIIAWLHTEPDDSDKSKRKIHQLYLQVGSEPWKPGVDHLSIAFRICVPRGTLHTTSNSTPN